MLRRRLSSSQDIEQGGTVCAGRTNLSVHTVREAKLSTREATPSDKISEPPAYPVCWLIIKKPSDATIPLRVIRVLSVVKHRTWFDARAEAMLDGTEAQDITIIQGERDHVLFGGAEYALPPELECVALPVRSARARKSKTKKRT